MPSPSAMPKVSVVIPARNVEPYVRPAVRSILRQSVRELECIIVDDGSTDRTPAILEQFAGSDSRVKVIRTDGGGISRALNTGIAAASAPIIARMDGDDISHPRRLELQLAALDAYPEITFLGALERSRHNFALLWPRWPKNTADPNAALTRIGFDELARGTQLVHPTMVYRTESIRRVDGYDEAFPYGEDSDLCYRAAKAGEQFARLETRLLLYRRHTGQATHGTFSLAAEFGYFRAAHGVPLPVPLARKNTPEMLALARQLLMEKGIPGIWNAPEDQIMFARILRCSLETPYPDWDELFAAYCHTLDAMSPDSRFGKAWELLQEARAYRER